MTSGEVYFLLGTLDSIGGVMVSVLASSAVTREFEPQSTMELVFVVIVA
jgi:hypothetical protein